MIVFANTRKASDAGIVFHRTLLRYRSTHHQHATPPRREVPILLRTEDPQDVIVLMNRLSIVSPLDGIPPSRAVSWSVWVSQRALEREGGGLAWVGVVAIHARVIEGI